MSDVLTVLTYVAPTAALVLVYARRQQRLHRASLAHRDANIEAGLMQPASLHPAIDPLTCIGCKACINACPEMPEHRVLGLIHGKAELVSPGDCIGHGACLSACPVGAITLVFGTETRGVDIPNVGPDFQTNVPGIYIAGELGGMGLIRNAIGQGRQAIEAIAHSGHSARAGAAGRAPGEIVDVVIIGAGPAGFSASLAAMERGLSFVTVEQDSLGGTVAHYPRGKLVMAGSAQLPLVGAVSFGETSKENLLGFWQKVQRETGVRISFKERAEAITRNSEYFQVRTNTREIRARNVLLAIGRRGMPRQLGVPGEDLTKVTYRLIDPDQYRNRRVLVVGGGDSALEAAAAIAEIGGTRVAISYRAAAFGRAKAANRDRVQSAAAAGRIQVLLQSELVAIEQDRVRLRQAEGEIELPNDAVIINAGGVLPTDFLQSIGVRFETKFGTA
jgi:thioredoxin reductase